MTVARVVAGRFELGPRAGAGGMGEVFRAHDRERGGLAAVKLLREGVDADRFVREAALLAQLRDEHVVGYLAHGVEPGGTHFLAMEWIPGETVHGRLSTTGFDVREAVWLARGIASGLAGAPRIGVVHRDIKPRNVILADGDPRRARIVDFGLGKQRQLESTLTRTGMVLGTPGYLSPEQALGLREIDERADLFALGVILHEALTGCSTFSGSNSVAVVCKVIAFDPPPVSARCPEAPPALVELCARLIDKHPTRRPRDAAEVVAALDAIEVADPGPRRPRRAAAPVTEVATVASPPIQFVVLATPPLDDDGAPIPLAAETVSALAEAGVAALDDGSLLAVIEDRDESAGARRAAQLGETIAARVPGAIVVAGAGSADRAAAIDEGAAALERRIREVMFPMIRSPA